MGQLIAKWFPHDKCLHFISGLLLFMMCLPFALPSTAAMIVFSVAVVKEWYDSQNRSIHTPEVMDAFATLFGALVGWGTIILNSCNPTP